jgi:HAD superfamily hydrolase (TIGR01509 family)
MKAPSAVIFDLGKVLLDFDYRISSKKIADQSTIPSAKVFALLCESQLPYRLESGLLTNEQFFAEVRAATGFRGSLDDFIDYFADIFSEIEPMTALQASIRARGVPTYIFSNTNEIAIRHVRQRYPFFANFDGYFLSYELGVMKPDARIYEIAENKTGHKGQSLLYLDDRAENVEAAAVRGWRVILHSDPAITRAAVEDMFA